MIPFLPKFNDYLNPENLTEDTTFVGKIVNPSKEVTPIPVVYGLRRITPPRIFTSGSITDTSKLVAIYALSEGECRGIYRLFVDGNQIDLPSNVEKTTTNGSSRINITKGLYADQLSIEFYHSTNPFAIPRLINDNIPDTMIYNNTEQNYANISLLVCEFTYLGPNSPYSSVPTIEVDLFGRVIRKAGDLGQPAEYRNNPADVIQDLLTNDEYGKGLSDGLISQTAMATARAVFDADIKDPPTDNNTQKTNACNMVLDTSRSIQDNINTILQNFNASLPYISGQFNLIAETSVGSVAFTINEDSIVGTLSIDYPDQQTLANQVKVQYYDAENNFGQDVVTYPDKDTINALVASDGRPLETTFTASCITNPFEAGRLARTIFEKKRQSRTFKFTAVKSAYQIAVGDIININTTTPSVNEDVQVIEMTVNADNTIEMTCVTHNNNNYPPFTGRTISKKYTKPIIPVGPGFILPVNPNPPISVQPPNPDDPPPPPESPYPEFPPTTPPGDITPPTDNVDLTISGATVLPGSNGNFYIGTTNRYNSSIQTTNYNSDGIHIRIMEYNSSIILVGEPVITYRVSKGIKQRYGFTFSLPNNLYGRTYKNFGYGTSPVETFAGFLYRPDLDVSKSGKYFSEVGGTLVKNRYPIQLYNRREAFEYRVRHLGKETSYTIPYSIPSQHWMFLTMDIPQATKQPYGAIYNWIDGDKFSQSITLLWFDDGYNFVGTQTVNFGLNHITPYYLESSRRLYKKYTGSATTPF